MDKAEQATQASIVSCILDSYINDGTVTSVKNVDSELNEFPAGAYVASWTFGPIFLFIDFGQVD